VTALAPAVVITDGGRAEAGFQGKTGDCVSRALAIATEVPYRQCYDLVAAMNWHHGLPRSARNGAISKGGRGGDKEFLDDLFEWEPLMQVGSGCRVHLHGDELPGGRIIARVTRHLVAVIDGVLHDTYDASRGGTRCVYGVWHVDAPVPGHEAPDYWADRIAEWTDEYNSRPRKKERKR
jgi:hypothetical protein